MKRRNATAKVTRNSAATNSAATNRALLKATRKLLVASKTVVQGLTRPESDVTRQETESRIEASKAAIARCNQAQANYHDRFGGASLGSQGTDRHNETLLT